MKRDDWAAYDYCVHEILADIRARLKTGCVTLNADECALVLANLQTPEAPKHRPADNNTKIYAALYSLQLEQSGMPARDAVAAAATRFSLSKWTVNAARRDMLQK